MAYTEHHAKNRGGATSINRLEYVKPERKSERLTQEMKDRILQLHCLGYKGGEITRRMFREFNRDFTVSTCRNVITDFESNA